MFRKIVAVALIVVTLICVCFVATACEDYTDHYTLEQHFEWLSAKMETYVNSEMSQYKHITGYTIYPLYNVDDEVEVFLIELEPYGFMFAKFSHMALTYKNFKNPRATYYKFEHYLNYNFYRYRFNVDAPELDLAEGLNWYSYDNIYDTYEYYDLEFPSDFRGGGRKAYHEVDEMNNFVGYNHSPYMTANVLDQKLYALDVYRGYVPAIKQNGKFINLVSMQEFVPEGNGEYYKNLGSSDYVRDYVYENIPYLSVLFFCHCYL